MAKTIDARIPALVVMVAILLKIFLILPPVYEKIKALSSARLMEGYQKEKAVAERIKKKLMPADKFVVFTNFYTPDSYLSNFLFRHAVIPQMEIVALSAYPDKKYDYTDFKNKMQDGSIGWMLMKSRDTAKLFYEIALDKYQLTDSLNGFSLYKYKR
jgi:hypothetical protein